MQVFLDGMVMLDPVAGSRVSWIGKWEREVDIEILHSSSVE